MRRSDSAFDDEVQDATSHVDRTFERLTFEITKHILVGARECDDALFVGIGRPFDTPPHPAVDLHWDLERLAETARWGGVGHLFAAFVNSMSAAMAVLKRRASISSPTLAMV